MKLPLSLVSYVSINAKTDKAVDVIVEFLGGTVVYPPYTIEPFRCSDGTVRIWRTAEVEVGGVRLRIDGPQHEVTPITVDPAGPAIELVSP